MAVLEVNSDVKKIHKFSLHSTTFHYMLLLNNNAKKRSHRKHFIHTYTTYIFFVQIGRFIWTSFGPFCIFCFCPNAHFWCLAQASIVFGTCDRRIHVKTLKNEQTQQWRFGRWPLFNWVIFRFHVIVIATGFSVILGFEFRASASKSWPLAK